jgi:uncharacterized protein YdaU (DUF1376 family)
VSAFDWFKCYPADLLQDMAGMTLEERGAYCTIVNQIMLTDRPLPDDDRHIAGLLRCHVNKWKPIRRALIAAGKLESIGNTLDVPTIVWVREARHTRHKDLTQAGHKGGKASAEARKINAHGQAHASSRRDERRGREEEIGLQREIDISRSSSDRASYWCGYIEDQEADLVGCTDPAECDRIEASIASARAELVKEER